LTNKVRLLTRAALQKNVEAQDKPNHQVLPSYHYQFRFLAASCLIG